MKVERRFGTILRAVEGLTRKYGYPPSLQEVSDRVGLKSKSTIHHHVQKLIIKGYLTHIPGNPRTLRRTKKTWK